MGSKKRQAKVEVNGGAGASDGATKQEGENGEEQEDQRDNQPDPGDDNQFLVLPGKKVVKVVQCKTAEKGAIIDDLANLPKTEPPPLELRQVWKKISSCLYHLGDSTLKL